MAGAIAFNVLVAIVPLVLAVLGIAGTILRFDENLANRLLDLIVGVLPPVSPEFVQGIRLVMIELMERSAGLLSVGTLILIWIATRLIGTLRTALREIFDVQQDRGIVYGKLFDLQMVVIAGALFALNVGVTLMLEVVTRVGFEFLGFEGLRLQGLQVFVGRAVAFLSIWTMFLLIYRYLPPRRTRWRTSLMAATFTAALFELMKQGFAFYVANAAFFGTYGNLATLVILFLWIYYTAIAFVLGGEVAQVVTMQRIRKQQKERLG